MPSFSKECLGVWWDFNGLQVFLGYFQSFADASQSGKVKYPLDEILLLWARHRRRRGGDHRLKWRSQVQENRWSERNDEVTQEV
jgi:hypothetical protein